MTYNPNIPQPTDIPSSSQAQLLANFQQLNTIFGAEHIAFNAIADNGEHQNITFNDVLGADPNLADPKASLYTKTTAGDSELFFEKFDVAGAVNIVRQLTNLTITNGVRHGGTQYTFMSPWGIRFTCGSTAAFSGTSTDTFITAFASVVYTVLCTANDANVQRVSNTANTTTLNLYTENSVSVYYIAIGD